MGKKVGDYRFKNIFQISKFMLVGKCVEYLVEFIVIQKISLNNVTKHSE